MNDSTIIIGDFGASAQYKQNCSTFVGTTAYMAPEMTTAYHTKGVYDSKVDLWSVGVGYYKLLFGRFPFGAKNDINQDIQEVSGKNLKFHDNINNVSEYTKDLLRRILEKDPQQRLTWEEFFEHELFTIPEDKLVPKGNAPQLHLAVSNSQKVNELFNQSKIDASEFDPKARDGKLLEDLVK